MGNRLARLELSLGGAPGFWLPERCFWFPWCFFFPEWCFRFPGGFGGSQGVFSSRAGVFSVPRFGLDVPGMVCWAPVSVFSSRDGVSGSQRGRHGGVCGSHTVFRVPVRVPPLLRCFFVASSLLLLASSCFSAFLCFLASFLPSFHLSSFPPLLPCFLSFFFPVLRSCLPPSFPASSCRSFNLPSVLPFLASCPCFLPFPSLSFRFLSLP